MRLAAFGRATDLASDSVRLESLMYGSAVRDVGFRDWGVGAVWRVITARVGIEEFLRQQWLVGDVGVADQRRHWPRRDVELCPHRAVAAARDRSDVIVVEQIGRESAAAIILS